METDEELILGILGGMGPMAGVEFQKRIIEKMPARNDQEHIKMVCFTNPKIHDRTSRLVAGGDFSSEVVQSFNLMKEFNVSLGVMTCNTAHSNFEAISAQVDFPLINMIEETVDFIAKKYFFAGRIGILATDGTLQSGIYEKALKERGMGLVVPEDKDQKDVMDVIYGRSGIKSGCINSNRMRIMNIMKSLETAGADVIILGCTELSLLGISGRGIIDPLDVVAEVVFKKAGIDEDRINE